MKNFPPYKTGLRRDKSQKRSIFGASTLVCVFLMLLDPATAHTQGTYALRPSTYARLISLREAIKEVQISGRQVKVAEEQLEQSRSRIGRAWSLYLPKLVLSGNLKFNFPEIKTSIGSSAQNNAQGQLFESVSQLIDLTQSLRTSPADRFAASAESAQLAQNGSALKAQRPISVVINPQYAFDAKLALTQPLINVSAYYAIGNAQLEVERFKATVHQQQSSSALEVARSYLAVVRAKRLENVAQSQQKRAQAQLGRTQKRHQHALVRLTDVYQMQVDLNDARDKFLQAQNQSTIALGQLGVLLGQDEEFAVEINPEFDSLAPSSDLQTLLDDGLKLRHEIIAQQIALKIAEQTYKKDFAQLFPVLDLVAQGFYSSNTSGFVNKAFRAEVMLSASIPLFDGGDTYAKIGENAAKIREQQLLLADLKTKVEMDIRGKISSLSAKKLSMNASKENVRLQNLIYNESVRSYHGGLSDAFEMIQNHHALFSSEIAFENARTDLDLAAIDLAYATGILLDAP